MPTQDLHFLTIAEAAQPIAAGDLSPVELTAYHLRRSSNDIGRRIPRRPDGRMLRLSPARGARIVGR
jgi:hypothetical protein